MSYDDDLADDLDAVEEPAAGRGLVRTLGAVITVAVLVVAIAGGYFWGNRSDDTAAASTPSTTSVDAGFARDMSTHHRQAVTMAEYTLANSTDPDIKLVAFDIDATQSVQLGEMQGWLDSWNVSPTASTRMSWMGAGMSMPATDLMPGMATSAQMNELESAKGKALDILFLQLMIRHHQGGVSMANYAAAHATTSYVRLLAQKMAALQTSEITQMEQLLRARGGSPLSPPS